MKSIYLFDGGLGQEIFKRSKNTAHPLWSIKVMMDQPEIIKEVHKDFIKAGAQIITTNSYTSTPSRLKRDGQIEWFKPLQKQALEIALSSKKELESSYHDIKIAGCLPPLIGSYTSDPRSFEEIKEEYLQIIDVQNESVDFFLIETISAIKEAQAAAEAVLQKGREFYISFTLSDVYPGQLRSGESIEEAVKAMSVYPISGLMFNCSKPESITLGLKKLENLRIPYGAYANGFTTIDSLKIGGTVDSLQAREDLDKISYAEYALSWIKDGATLIGGCCEVGPSHIAYLKTRVENEGHKFKSF